MEENALTMRTMTNEELAVLIQKGERQYLPALYKQVERLLWHSVRRYAARCEDRMKSRGGDGRRPHTRHFFRPGGCRERF